MRRVFLFIFILVIFPITLNAETKGKVAVGLVYPGICVKVKVQDKLFVEPRVMAEGKVLVVGARTYFNIKGCGECFGKGVYIFYLGSGINYTKFEGTSSKGIGYAVEGFFGVEYFLNERVSVCADFGPAYISLKDKDIALKESGIEWVINIGAIFYI
jgi:hypothetical protein